MKQEIHISDSLTVVIDKSANIEEGDYVYDSHEKRVEIATSITVVCQKSSTNVHSKIIGTIGENDFIDVPVLESTKKLNTHEVDEDLGIIDKILIGQQAKKMAINFHDWVVANEYEAYNREQRSFTTAELFTIYLREKQK